MLFSSYVGVSCLGIQYPVAQHRIYLHRNWAERNNNSSIKFFWKVLSQVLVGAQHSSIALKEGRRLYEVGGRGCTPHITQSCSLIYRRCRAQLALARYLGIFWYLPGYLGT